MIDGVESAPEDASICSVAEVMELMVAIAETFTSVPANGVLLCLSERLGHEDVIVDGDNVIGNSFEQRGIGVGGKGNLAGVHLSMRGEGDDLVFFLVEFGDRGMLVETHAEIEASLAQTPGKLSRVDDSGIGAFDAAEEERRFNFALQLFVI